MKKQKETILTNNLWRIRRRAGLEQKQVAKLLNHHSSDTISRYELGVYLPGLKNIIKLIIIYQTPLEQLFPEHFQYYRAELENRLSRIPRSLISRTAQQTVTQNIHHCTYEKLLEKSPPSKDDLNTVRDHITTLAKSHVLF